MHITGPVIVMQSPEQWTHTEVEKFLSELSPLLESDGLRIVLDCSQVRYVDSAGVEMLLRSVREAMKCDGGLKVAAVSPASGVIMELMRLDRLFEMFLTTEEAVRSFYEFPYRGPRNPGPQGEPGPSVFGIFADSEAAS